MKLFFVVCTLLLSTSFVFGAEDRKEVGFVFQDYAISVKYDSTKEYENTIHYRDCIDLTVHYNVALGIAESCEIKEVEMGSDKNILVVFAKLKLPNGTVTFCEWPIGKFVNPNAKKDKEKENVRIYLADPPRKIVLVPKGKMVK